MLRSQKGQAMILVLFFTTAILMLVGVALAISASFARSSVREVNQKQAYYIAEAGVNQALQRLLSKLVYEDPDFSTDDLSNKEYYGGVIDSVTSVKEKIGDTTYYTIVSKAHYPATGKFSAAKTIEAKVEIVKDPFLEYGGPGIKAEENVFINKNEILPFGTSVEGSFVAREGNIEFYDLIYTGISGGLYAGQDVILDGGLISEGTGDIKAGRDVKISAISKSWKGEIWYGRNTNLPEGPNIHKSGNIPGFPIPQFPDIDKRSLWYNYLFLDARSHGKQFDTEEAFLDDPVYGIQWKYSVVGPILGIVTVLVTGAELNLNGLYVIGNQNRVAHLHLNDQAYHEAYARLQQRIRQEYPGMVVLFGDLNFGRLRINASQPVTLVADTITLEQGLISFLGIDTEGINAPFGLFAVNGDVNYYASLGGGSRLAVLANGSFYCPPAGSWDMLNFDLKLDWVAVKENLYVNAPVVINSTKKSAPPGTPIGYKIVSWIVK